MSDKKAGRPWPDCPTCGGKGYTESDNPSFGFDNRFACRTCPALWKAFESSAGYGAGVARAVSMLRDRARAIRTVEHAEHPGNAPCSECSTQAKKSNALEAAADEIEVGQ